MPLPIVSVRQMREWEQAAWAAGKMSSEVIARVGRVVAERAVALTSAGDLILILAGKGHNGDDARAAVPRLTAREVILLEVTDPKAVIETLRATLRERRVGLIIDGLFGIGLSRDLDDSWKEIISVVNDSSIPVLAIDVPSGLDADSGKMCGTAMRATVTLTIGAAKKGLLEPLAIPFVGRLEVAADVGLSPCPIKAERNWTVGEDFANFPPTREVQSHKGTYGHLAIVAGSIGFHGAAILATRGALRAQPGLVSLYSPKEVYVPIASQLQAAMVHPWRSAADLPESTSAILFGPGLAANSLPKNLKSELVHLWRTSALPIIADASALDWLEPGKCPDNSLRVITPHPGEAARMLSMQTNEVQSNRWETLQKLSARYGNCFVVLKGHQTIVGRNEGDIFVNNSGNPFLAQGGSGDVLAGYISGLLAQQCLAEQPLKTIRFAVWQHGCSADRLARDRRNWTIDDLCVALGNEAGS